MSQKDKLIVLLGPTAVGKTELSLNLAEFLKTDIISGDSMLIYKDLNIGTAKPTQEELARVKHYMINILPPFEKYNVTDFIEQVGPLITKINKDGKIPILAGGTGLYIKALLEGYVFNEIGEDKEYRAYLEQLVIKYGKEYIFNMLKEKDPETAKRLHINNFRRIIRALEVAHLGKETISQVNHYERTGELLYDVKVIGLNRQREELYKRINQRVDIMIANGLVEEVREILESGGNSEWQSLKGIGYKEIIPFIEGKISLEKAVDDLKKNTRHFAKRQLTWFNKMDYIQWFNISDYESSAKERELFSDIIKNILDKWETCYE